MSSENVFIKNKGGRPKSPAKKAIQLAVMCEPIEAKYIRAQARKLNISVSQYLRDAGMKCQVVMKIKTLPREVLLLTATLNHIAASLNQIAKKRNMGEQLDILEQAELAGQHIALKQLAVDIKNAFL